MKSLHTATSAIELGAGLGLLAVPSLTAALLIGVPLETPVSRIVARVAGSALLALAVACWLARSDWQSRAARGLVAGMLIYDLGVAGILAHAGIASGMHGVALWPAVILHTLLGGWCAACLRGADG